MPELNVHLHDFNSNRSCGADKIYDIDKLHKASIATRMKTSLTGTAALRSNAKQRPDPQVSEGAPRLYDTDINSIAKSVQQTPQVYANLRSRKPKAVRIKKQATPFDAQYDIQMNDMNRAVEKSSIVFSSMKSKQSRSNLLQIGKDSPDSEYNTDTGRYAGMSTKLLQKKNQYGKFDAKSARVHVRSHILGEPKCVKVDNDSPNYEVNALTKRDMFTTVLQSPVKYAAVLRSKQSPHKTTEKHKVISTAKGGEYDTNCGPNKSMVKALENTGVRYSVMNSKVSRFSQISDACAEAARRREIGYQNLDKHKHQRMNRSKSTGRLPPRPKPKCNMIDGPQERFEKDPRPMYDTSLGPGSENRMKKKVQREQRLTQIRATAQFASRFSGNNTAAVEKTRPKTSSGPRTDILVTNEFSKATKEFTFSKMKRFIERVDPYKGLGSTNASKKMNKEAWAPKGGVIDTILDRAMAKKGPDSYLELDQGHKQTLVTALKNSQRCYTAGFTSKQARLADLRSTSAFGEWKPTVSDDIGPGNYYTEYSPIKKKDRKSTAFMSLGRNRQKFS